MPRGPAGEHQPLVIEPRHQHLDAAVHSPEHVLGRHLAVLKDQLAGVGAAHAELVELLSGGEALEALLDQERGDAARAGGGIGLGVDDENVGLGAVGDPHLGAVQHVPVASPVRPGAHRDDVRAGIRLAHGERADVLAGDQFRQISPLLPLRAVAADSG